MPKIRVNDIDIYYEMEGTGPAMLYIGGTGSDLRNRPDIFDSPLPRHFTVLAYDQRGFGQSDKPDIPYTMLDYANDAAALTDAIGWKCALVVGVSFGGMVAQELLLQNPQRVDRAALLCTSSGGEGGDSYPLQELSALAVPERARRLLELSDVRWNHAWQKANAAVFDALLAQRIAEMQYIENNPEMKAGAVRQLKARRHHNTWDRLPEIKNPVGIFGGSHDGIARPENLENLHRQIPGSNMKMFNGGHFFFMQDSTAWPAIIDFLLP